MHWATKYIGKKPEEVDFCWGLVRLIYAEFGVELPKVEGLTRSNAEQIASKVRGTLAVDWAEVLLPFEGCVVGMSQTGGLQFHHVGVFTNADRGKVIHCWGSQNTIADGLRSLRLKGFQTIKFFRHRLWPL